MKILIVGAGIGGLALASFLKEKGIHSEIVEKAPNWDNLGYGINIWNNGRLMLKKLNLHHKFDELGKVESEYFLATGKGKIIKLKHFREFLKKYWPAFTTIHRGDLHNILMESAQGTPIKMNTFVKSIVQDENKVDVLFNDNTKASYDVVIGSDGVKSQVRDLTFQGDFLHYIGWRAYYIWVDRRFKMPKGVYEMNEPGQVCVFFHQREGKNMAVLAMPADHRIWDDEGDRLERIKANFKDCKFLLPEILEHAKAKDLLPTDIAFVKMDKWVNGRVALLGDAAHAMEPFAGMGGSMALEDAYVLAEELGKRGAKDIKGALEAYQERRYRRIDIARSQTHQRWSMLKSTSSLFVFFRNLFAPFVSVNHFTKGYERLLKEKI